MDGLTVHLSNNPQPLFTGSRCITTKQIVMNTYVCIMVHVISSSKCSELYMY